MMKSLRRAIGKGVANLVLVLEAVALVVVIVAAIVGSVARKDVVEKDVATDEKAVEENAVQESAEVIAQRMAETEASGTETEEKAAVQETAEVTHPEVTMTREEAVLRILTTPEGLTGNDTMTVTRAGENTENAFSEYPVGGLVYRTDNLTEEAQATNMLASVTGIAADQGVENPSLMIREADLDGHEEDYRGYGINTVLIDAMEDGAERDGEELEASISAAEAAGYTVVLYIPMAEATEETISGIREKAGFDGAFATTVSNDTEAENAAGAGVQYLFLEENFRTLYPGILERLTAS